MAPKISDGRHRYPEMRGAPRTREPITEKQCAHCGKTKPVSEFNINRKHKDGLAAWCKPCNAKNLKRWAEENKEHKRRLTFASHLRKTYGIDIDEYERMLEAQGGVCAICKEPCARKSRLSVDHCHTTGKNRGLLCDDCNNGLGRFRDRPDLCRAAADYAELHHSA
jgi:Recombination endonuclease VII